MNRNVYPVLMILPIFLTLLVSGCISFGGSSGPLTGEGVVIRDFKPDFSSVESGDTVRLYLRVQNIGGEEAKDVVAKLSGIDIGANAWNLIKGSEEEEIGDLSPPNLRYGTEGESKEIYWELEAPSLPEGIENDYKPFVRVYYRYKTTATKIITVLNRDELRRLSMEGKSLSSQPTKYSDGPLKVDVITGKYVTAPPDRDPSFPITIHIENVGDGVISSRQGGWYYSENEDYEVKLTIEMPDGLSLEPDCSQYEYGEKVKLWEGKTADITCDVDITRVPDISEDKTIKITLEYDYYTDAYTTISVKGTGEESGWW
ncbi:MAG: hypothetical protein DRP15_00650 [Candidatus Aenigmatarchaeota archaeon]|nr:MAG: hypothetical protein DRP15_00650 [Candidatus Aenigmarchaeota archaeon]